MKARVIVTDLDGRTFEGEAELVPVGGAGQSASRRSRGQEPASPAHNPGSPKGLDFGLPIRAFMNRYAKGCAGHQAFTLLVARLAAGELGAEVKGEQVRQEWDKMTGLLGGSFATVYGTRAKNQAWVDSPSRGVFVLLPDWTQVVAGTLDDSK